MKIVQEHIARRQREFAEHPFFARLARNEPFDRAMAFAPGLTFWVMAFQDILRLNETKIRDSEMRKIARHHRVEDAGHDKWFMDDIEVLDGAKRDVHWLFGKHHTQTRDAAYALMSEVFRASDDRVRVVLLLTLESAGHVFFERVANYVDQTGFSDKLRYFARSHLQAEKGHELFENQLHEQLLNVDLPQAVRMEAVAMIDRVYSAFLEMFDGLEVRIVRRASGTFSVRPPAGTDSSQQRAAKG